MKGYCCDKFKIISEENMIHIGYDGPNQITFYNYNPNERSPHYYHTVYIGYCPFCGVKLQ